MSDMILIKAEERVNIGKEACRKIRNEGRVPAIIYGENPAPEPISLNARELSKLVNKGKFLTSICSIDINGKITRVIPRDIAFHPLHETILHVDFLRLGEKARIDVSVPVRFLNEQSSPGIKTGGVLNIVRHEIELRCAADSIPDHVDVDLKGLEIGDSVHISTIKLPENVAPTISDRDFTIATIAPPASSDEEANDMAADKSDKK